MAEVTPPELSCHEILEFLLEYDEGTLHVSVSAEFERHLECCPPCGDYVRGYHQAIEIGRESCYCDDERATIPEDLVHAILTARTKVEAPPPESTPAKAAARESLPSRLTPDQALSALGEAAGCEFLSLFRHGSLEIEIYRPRAIDRQTPHTRDELYIVISGTGWFVLGSARSPFVPGEVIFAPAGVAHRFEQFTHDFATWVVFYGPEGGEAGR